MKRTFLIVAVLFCMNPCLSQETKEVRPKLYLGVSLGCSPVVIKSSTLFFDYGAELIYAYDIQYLMLSYSRVDAFNLKFDAKQKDDDSKMDRIEIDYGRITRLMEDHRVLRNIIIGGSIGLAYNSIRYYDNDVAFGNNKPVIVGKIELPIGFTISNMFDSQTFMALEIKYHILNNGMSYPDIKYFISLNIF